MQAKFALDNLEVPVGYAFVWIHHRPSPFLAPCVLTVNCMVLYLLITFADIRCVIVEDGKVISSGSNRTNATRNVRLLLFSLEPGHVCFIVFLCSSAWDIYLVIFVLPGYQTR